MPPFSSCSSHYENQIVTQSRFYVGTVGTNCPLVGAHARNIGQMNETVFPLGNTVVFNIFLYKVSDIWGHVVH